MKQHTKKSSKKKPHIVTITVPIAPKNNFKVLLRLSGDNPEDRLQMLHKLNFLTTLAPQSHFVSFKCSPTAKLKILALIKGSIFDLVVYFSKF